MGQPQSGARAWTPPDGGGRTFLPAPEQAAHFFAESLPRFLQHSSQLLRTAEHTRQLLLQVQASGPRVKEVLAGWKSGSQES